MKVLNKLKQVNINFYLIELLEELEDFNDSDNLSMEEYIGEDEMDFKEVPYK